MEKQKEINQRSFSNFGFSSILLTFVMLCIVTFSALSLLTANADYKLSKKVADKTTAYYQAEEKAYLLLQKIDQDLAHAYKRDLLCTRDRIHNTGKIRHQINSFI